SPQTAQNQKVGEKNPSVPYLKLVMPEPNLFSSIILLFNMQLTFTMSWKITPKKTLPDRNCLNSIATTIITSTAAKPKRHHLVPYSVPNHQLEYPLDYPSIPEQALQKDAS